MHKNTEEKNRERLDLIMNTALRLYREKSSSEVSVLDICQACQMTKPTFYKYVDSKEQILAHYFQGSMEETTRALEEMDPSDHLAKVYYGVTYGIRKVNSSDRDLLKSYFNYCLKEHEPANIYGEQWQDTMEKELDLARHTGQICSRASSDLLFKSLGSLALGLGMQSTDEDEDDDQDLYGQYISYANKILAVPAD